MEREFEPSSYAYRPGRSHRMAVDKVAHWRNSGYEWVLDADITDYFGSIQHDRLLAEVRERAPHPWIADLIQDRGRRMEDGGRKKEKDSSTSVSVLRPPFSALLSCLSCDMVLTIMAIHNQG